MNKSDGLECRHEMEEKQLIVEFAEKGAKSKARGDAVMRACRWADRSGLFATTAMAATG